MTTCLILGAGATLANALHFHGERMIAQNPPLDYTFFDKISALGITIPTELRAYAAGNGTDPFKLKQGQPGLRMEEFFKDLFSDFQGASRGGRTALAYEQLIDVYIRVLRMTTDWMAEEGRRGGPIGRLIAAAPGNEDLTVMTFNQDLVIENEIVKRARLQPRWCIEQGYGSMSARLEQSSVVGGATRGLFPAHGTSCDHSTPITVLKLHGSLNWYVRMSGRHPSRAVLSGSGTTPQLHCTRRREVPHQLRFTRTGARSGRTRWYTWPVVVPPVHGKEVLIRNFVPEVWADAEAALRDAERIVFVGYSLPMLDVNAERLFKRSIAANTTADWIDVVNPSPDAAQRYAAIASPTTVRWYYSIDSFLTADGFV